MSPSYLRKSHRRGGEGWTIASFLRLFSKPNYNNTQKNTALLNWSYYINYFQYELLVVVDAYGLLFLLSFAGWSRNGLITPPRNPIQRQTKIQTDRFTRIKHDEIKHYPFYWDLKTVEVGGYTFLRNAGNHSPSGVASHPRRRELSIAPLWKPWAALRCSAVETDWQRDRLHRYIRRQVDRYISYIIYEYILSILCTDEHGWMDGQTGKQTKTAGHLGASRERLTDARTGGQTDRCT